MELTRCLFHQGHERGFNRHAFSEVGTATGIQHEVPKEMSIPKMIFVDKTGVNLLIGICVVKINSEQQARGKLGHVVQIGICRKL